MSSKTVHLSKPEKPEAPSRLADNDSAFSPEALNHNGALSQDGELSSNSNGGDKNIDEVVEPESIRVALA